MWGRDQRAKIRRLCITIFYISILKKKKEEEYYNNEYQANIFCNFLIFSPRGEGNHVIFIYYFTFKKKNKQLLIISLIKILTVVNTENLFSGIF